MFDQCLKRLLQFVPRLKRLLLLVLSLLLLLLLAQCLKLLLIVPSLKQQPLLGLCVGEEF